MFFACRLHKAHQAYVEQQRLISDMQQTPDNSAMGLSNNGVLEISNSYLLIQQSNDSFLELVVSSDNSNNSPMDSAAIFINGIPVTTNTDSGSGALVSSNMGSNDIPTDFGSDVDGPSAKLAASWGHLQLTEGKITARELRLGFFATLMALLTVCMFLYGIATVSYTFT